jgi:hypothetical protein
VKKECLKIAWILENWKFRESGLCNLDPACDYIIKIELEYLKGAVVLKAVKRE